MADSAYTTIAKVRLRATDFDTSPADGAITAAINHAAGIIDTVTYTNWDDKIAADATKYRLIEQVATDLAAAWMVASDPALTTTNSEAALMIDIFWASASRGLKLLSDKRVVEYLKGL